MKNIYILCFLMIASFSYASDDNDQGIITEDLKEYLNQKKDNSLIRVNISLTEQFNMMDNYSQLRSLSNNERRSLVVSELKNKVKNSQSSLLKSLSSKSSEHFKLIHSFWISNTITCLISEETLS